MTLSLQELHRIELEITEIRRKIPALELRRRRAGAFKTRDRLQERIDTHEDEIKALERRLIASWRT